MSSATRARRTQQQAVLAALEFKCGVLWAMLDALHHAYVDAEANTARRVRAEGLRTHGERAIRRDRQARPRLPRGVRLTHNEAQGGWVLLAPERVFKADAIAAEILKRCTGEATSPRSSTTSPRPSTRRASASTPT